jgi:hypothetical protein
MKSAEASLVAVQSQRRHWLAVIIPIALALSAAGLTLSFLSPGGIPDPTATLDAGVVTEFSAGTLRYYPGQHVFVVRDQAGGFLALYDWDAWAQRRQAEGEGKAGCRVHILDPIARPELGALRFLVGTEATRPRSLDGLMLRSGCDGSSFDGYGHRTFGPAGADLDTFDVKVDVSDHVVVDLTARHCQILSPCLAYR